MGQSKTDEAIARLCKIIEPNEATYVAAQDPNKPKTVLHVDVLGPNKVSGWARASNGVTVTLIVDVDGRPVTSIMANKPRRDLAMLFGGEGNYAFHLDLPPEMRLSKGAELLIRNAADDSLLFRKTFDG